MCCSISYIRDMLAASPCCKLAGDSVDGAVNDYAALELFLHRVEVGCRARVARVMAQP